MGLGFRIRGGNGRTAMNDLDLRPGLPVALCDWSIVQ
jgi:hypothetical protein